MPTRWIGVLLALGFAADALTGRAYLLVRPWFLPVLVVTAVAVAVATTRLHGKLRAQVAIVLLLPIAVGATLTPAVVSKASQRAVTASTLPARIGDSANPLLDGRGGSVTLLQILLAEQHSGGVILAGRQVTVEAMAAGPHLLKRSVILCCAADAQTVTLAETGPSLPRPGTWLRIHGQLATRGDRTVLTATAVTEIPTPANPFL